jgi:hypothetical protein
VAARSETRICDPHAVPVSAADRVEINELMARYNRAADSGRAEELADCYVADGEFTGPAGHARGREELVRLLRDYWTLPRFADLRIGRHWVNNVIVEDEGGDEASVSADHAMFVPVAGGGGAITVIGRYDDRVRKVDGRWLFVTRTVDVWQTSAAGLGPLTPPRDPWEHGPR